MMKIKLLSFPEEILQHIARHFTLTQWAQGPAQACRLLHGIDLHKIHLTCFKAERGMSKAALAIASNEISNALACAGRHTGPGTISISLRTQAVHSSLDHDFAWPVTVTGSSILANVVCLELELHGYEKGQDDTDVLRFTLLLLQKVPNLTAARLWYHAYPAACIMLLPKLRHLDLGLMCLVTLEGLPLGEILPMLETACITALGGDMIAELNASGCQHLTQLVLIDVQVYSVLKPPLCRLRMELLGWDQDVAEARRLQPALSEVHETYLYNEDFYKSPRAFWLMCPCQSWRS